MSATRRKNNINSRRATRSVWRRIPARYRLILCIAALALVVGAHVCRETQPEAPASQTTYAPGTYGDGSAALLEVRTDSGRQPLPSEELRYAGMDVSFNPERHIPNWVAWELTADETAGDVKRTNRFVSDPGVAASATYDDYRGSGYDRGHMAPAGDMKWSREAMDETFYFTNICPQSKQLNTGAWRKLEEKCRKWARRDSAIVIVCGPVNADPVAERIGRSGVAVPRRFFKVVLAPYAMPPRGIGFIMDNAPVEGGMAAAAVSIDEVERVTGLDFFFQLPDEIESVVEAQNNFNDWN